MPPIGTGSDLIMAAAARLQGHRDSLALQIPQQQSTAIGIHRQLGLVPS